MATATSPPPGRLPGRPSPIEWIKFAQRALHGVDDRSRPPSCPSLGAVFVAATGSLQPDDTVLGGSLTPPSSPRCWPRWSVRC